MRKHTLTWIIGLVLTLTSTAAVIARPAEAQIEAEQEVLQAAPAPVELDRRYEAYGFLLEGYEGHERYGRFTEHQVEVLGAVIVAYADLVGGPERLSALVNGPVRVRRDLREVLSYTQAGQVIGLGRGAFDPALTQEANYYTWGATSGDELAQIVFGHEIGHRWIEALRREAGADWGDVYGRNVWRGERASLGTWAEAAELEGGQGDAEEEAVTNLALAVLSKGYRWTFLHDAPASGARQVWIDGWVYDLAVHSR